MEYSAELALEALQSSLVDDELFSRALGGNKGDVEAVRLYLRLPIAARPELSWFFDREFYLERYPDIRRGEIDPFVHFLKWGVGESRSPHPLIDPKYIRATYGESVLPEQPNCDQLYALLSNDLVDPSPFFSREHYRRQCDNGGRQLQSGLLLHFLQHGILHRLTPNPAIDVMRCYLQAEAGFDIRSGLRQFVLCGGKLPDGDSTLPAEWQTKVLFRSKAQSLLPIFARQPLSFEMTRPPDFSVIMVVHNQFHLTLMALASLRDNYPGNIELLIIDSGSTDETVHLSQYVLGGSILRFDDNIGFVRACAAAMELVSADYVLFLNNDVELTHGAVHAALHRLTSDTEVGAVGAKIVRSDGRLQEAGCIIWRDGWTSGYLRDESPLLPEANFVRTVEFCSLAFLLARTDVIRDVGGFDCEFAPAYFEDADLCLRITRSGRRVVYDPQIMVHHLEYGSSQSASDAHAQISRSHSAFVAKHQATLQQNHSPGAGTELLARSVATPKGRILFIEDQIPLRRLGSGFVRSNDIVRTLTALGYAVTVYPVKRSQFDIAAVYSDFPDTVEIMHDKSLAQFSDFIGARRGYYDAIWICRTHNLRLVKNDLKAYSPTSKVILDTEAISAIRDWIRVSATSGQETSDLLSSAEKELADASFCSTVIAVSEPEAKLLRRLRHEHVATLGHVLDPRTTMRDFAARAGMLFVGAIHTADSPNYDSLCWFADEVLPLIEPHLGWETRLTIVGFVAPDINLDRLRGHPRITVRGLVADLEPLYNSHRIAVAPTRFAAGLPYKLHEAASYGVPSVTTTLLAEQLGWENRTELLATDPSDAEGFAHHCVELYRSEELWTRLRESATRRLATECGRSNYAAKITAILQPGQDRERGLL